MVTVTPLQARRQFPTVSLQTDSLFKNIIQSDRGGYCFEQNLLFAAALKACGFSIYLMSVRYAHIIDCCRALLLADSNPVLSGTACSCMRTACKTWHQISATDPYFLPLAWTSNTQPICCSHRMLVPGFRLGQASMACTLTLHVKEDNASQAQAHSDTCR